MLSTGPTFDKSFEMPEKKEEEALYTNSVNVRLEQKQTMVAKTKIRTLGNLVSVLKARPNPPAAIAKKMRRTKSVESGEDIPVAREVSLSSYESVIRMLRASESCIPPRRKPVKVMVDLPQLPFGKHVTYNSVKNFRKSHVLSFDATSQEMDRFINEMWVSKMSQRRLTNPEPLKSPPKVKFNPQTEKLQLFNSRLKVASTNLYMHHTLGNTKWKKDLLDLKSGWRNLYHLEKKRISDVNLTYL